MRRIITRLVPFGLAAGAAILGGRWWRGRNGSSTSTDSPASWPKFDVGTPSTPVQSVVDAAPSPNHAPPTEQHASWVVPIDGQCPESHPIKANDDSGIYHLPGGRFYERTIAERCYANADDAERDGYRAAKA